MVPSFIPLHVTLMIVLCHVTAITCTAARLLYRWYTRRFWWEDIWAMIAAVWTVMCVVGFLLYDSSLSPFSPRNQISSWFGTLSSTVVPWAARLSIFHSFVRVLNPTGSLRYIALACIASFLIMCVASTAQKIYCCVAYDCFVSTSVAIMLLITVVFGDMILVLGPIPLLRDVHLPKHRRILIVSAFSSSILISAISITHSVFLMHDVSRVTMILAEMKVALSLFICNILVLVTFVYRVWRRWWKRDGIDLDASLHEAGPLYLTTIDLNQLTAGTLSGGNPNTNSTSGSRHFAVQDASTLECISATTEFSSWSVRSDTQSADEAVDCPSARGKTVDVDVSPPS